MSYLTSCHNIKAQIDSCATSREEIGCSIYPDSAAVLREHKIPIIPHRARQMTLKDAEEYDWLVGMDHNNIRNMKRMLPERYHNKIRMLNDHPIEDPWYSGSFEKVYQQIYAGCEKLLDELISK